MYKLYHHSVPLPFFLHVVCVLYTISVYILYLHTIFISSVLNFLLSTIKHIQFFFFLAMPRGLWDHSSPIKNWTQARWWKQNLTTGPAGTLQACLKTSREECYIYQDTYHFVVLHFWYSISFLYYFYCLKNFL